MVDNYTYLVSVFQKEIHDSENFKVGLPDFSP